MLLLKSPRWSELDTFFGESMNLPSVLKEWIDSIGFDQEMSNYNDLYQLFLHQVTTANAAYAVVPWIVEHLSRSQLEDQAFYLSDVATVELLRLTYVRTALSSSGRTGGTGLSNDGLSQGN